MSLQKLLIIEDEQAVAKQLKWGLAKEYDISIANNSKEAKELLLSGIFPVATLDLGLPPFPDATRVGFEILDFCVKNIDTKIIVITGNSEEKNAVKAIAAGAVDFCAKPIELDLLRTILSRTFRIYSLEEINRTNQKLATPKSTSLCGMIGVSPVMENLFSRLRKICSNNFPVLVTGESGTGKELACRAIHELSPRRNFPFVIINCGAITENLIESELFGHEKGSFTGAVSKQIGKFEQGDNGTVFLDEIGELPMAMQVKLLRCLQEGTIERVGGSKTIKLDIRIVAATNVDLEKAVGDGTFRKDLFHRLNVIPVNLPTLRQRSDDIVGLANHFLREESRNLAVGKVHFSPAAIAAMLIYPWPGNVRELQNKVRMALSLIDGKVISADELGIGDSLTNEMAKILPSLKEARKKADISVVKQAMAISGNNISQAARLLNTSRPTLHD